MFYKGLEVPPLLAEHLEEQCIDVAAMPVSEMLATASLFYYSELDDSVYGESDSMAQAFDDVFVFIIELRRFEDVNNAFMRGYENISK